MKKEKSDYSVQRDMDDHSRKLPIIRNHALDRDDLPAGRLLAALVTVWESSQLPDRVLDDAAWGIRHYARHAFEGTFANEHSMFWDNV